MTLLSITSAKSDSAGIVDNEYIDDVNEVSLLERLNFSLLTQIRENISNTVGTKSNQIGNCVSVSVPVGVNFADSFQAGVGSGFSTATARSNFNALFDGSSVLSLPTSTSQSLFISNHIGQVSSTASVTGNMFYTIFYTGVSDSQSVCIGESDPNAFFNCVSVSVTRATCRPKNFITDVKKIGGLSQGFAEVVGALETV